MFGTVLTTIFTIMHVYVFVRILTTPLITDRIHKRYIIITGVLLWALFYLGRVLGHHGAGIVAVVFELLGMNWMASLLLIFVCLLAVDLITGFGFIFPRTAQILRISALLTGVLLAVFAYIQGLRPPIVRNYELYFSELPQEIDGTVIIAIADTHIGSLIGEEWLGSRVAQIQKENPDMVLPVGDIFEGHGKPGSEKFKALKNLSAPLGVWGVLGNHDFRRHADDAAKLFEESGVKLLRNTWVEISPGFILAGVDNLSSRKRRRSQKAIDFVEHGIQKRPSGFTLFMSHTPNRIKNFSDKGIDLMLCGHTHGGQVWPFDYLVKSRYGIVEGLHNVNDMNVLVTRGAGTWGPRMRLPHPGEILRITLFCKK